MLELTDSLRISQVALEVTQNSLLEARDAIRSQKQRLQKQEEALLALSNQFDQLVQQVSARVSNLEARARTGTDAHWLCVQDFDDEAIYNLFLASAALPLVFPSREINGKTYVDGRLADNVPLKALVKRGCTHAIVIHQKNGAVWNRHDFPEQTIIEIRPSEAINKSEIPVIGIIDTYSDFSTQRIRELRKRGYADAKRCLEPIAHTFMLVREQRQTQQQLLNSTQRLLNDLPFVQGPKISLGIIFYH